MQDSKQIFCPIRKEWVAALPEEYVRQGLLKHMLEERGFPYSLIGVEKSLKHLPHLTNSDTRRIPDRRADIICFAKREVGLHPLLIVECKSIKLSSRVINQVVGYNHFVRSYFIAIVNQEEIRTGWYDQNKQTYVFVNYLPTYQELIQSISAKLNEKKILLSAT